MTDPVRLLEGTDDFERALLGSAKRDTGSERALGRALAAASGVVVTLGAAGSAGATAGVMLVVKWVAIGVLAGAMISGTATLVGEHSRPHARTENALLAAPQPRNLRPAAVVQATQGTPDGPEGSPTPVGAPSPAGARLEILAAQATPGAPNPQPSAAVHSIDLSRELALLESARQDLNHGSPRTALATLEQHDAEFPTAALEPEASLLQIQALCKLGKIASAKSLGERFLLAHPSGPYAARAHGLLDALP